MGLAPPRGLATHCNVHCIMCVAQGIRGPRWLDVIPTFLFLTKAVSSDTYNTQWGLRSLIHLRKPFRIYLQLINPDYTFIHPGSAGLGCQRFIISHWYDLIAYYPLMEIETLSSLNWLSRYGVRNFILHTRYDVWPDKFEKSNKVITTDSQSSILFTCSFFYRDPGINKPFHLKHRTELFQTHRTKSIGWNDNGVVIFPTSIVHIPNCER